MLVLTRKHQEKIRIGDQITITVLKTKGKAVRLGIEAPPDLVVIRGELAVDGAPLRERRPLSADDQADGLVETPPGERRQRPRIADVSSPWTTESGPLGGERTRRNSPAVEVSLRRVPRGEAPRILPEPAARGPLRAMVERR